MFNIKCCQRLDSNPGQLESEAITLPTEPQPLPLIYYATLTFVYEIGSCGQSYKHFTIVIYDPRVIIWDVFKSGATLEL